MHLKEQLARLGALEARLPFPVEDYEAANRAFACWQAHPEDAAGRDAALQVVELWLYCYVHRYVLKRLIRHPLFGGEADRLVGEVYQRARERFATVSDAAYFTPWVSVVCRNTLFNGLRRSFQPVDLDIELLDIAAPPELAFAEPDLALVRHTLQRALTRLPESIRQVATLRFLENRSYRHIAAVTGHPVPTVRSYAARAVQRLREDPGLRALGQALDLVPP